MLIKRETYKFCGFLAAVLLVQGCLGSSHQDSIKQSSPLPECGYYLNGDNITEYYLNNTLKAVHQILKDPTVIANHNKEVEEFKSNLTFIVSKYEEIKNGNFIDGHKTTDLRNSLVSYEEEALGKLVQRYLHISHHYFELPEEKMTTDSKFIANILTKHEGYYVLIIYGELMKAIVKLFIV